MSRRLTHIFFDFTNTLVRVRGSVGEVYARVARRHGLDVTATELDAHFDAAIDMTPQPVDPDLAPAEITARERLWWRELAARTLEPYGDFPGFDAFFDEVFDLFRHADAWELLPGVRESLDTLRRQGRRLGVISDMDARLYDVFDALELRDSFEFICLSFRTGYAKPDRRLYEAAIRRAGTAAAHCVHVGDSITKDVEGALAAGLLPIHLADHGVHTPSGAHRVGALCEIPNLLLRLEAGTSPGD